MVTQQNPDTNLPLTKPYTNWLVISLLMISILLNTFVLTLLIKPDIAGESGLYSVLMQHEYDKVGGRKIYDALTKIQIAGYKEQFPKMEEYIKALDTGKTSTEAANSVQPKEPQGPQPGTIGSSVLENIKKDAMIEGNKSAPITVIEYSEMECPFCAQLYHDTKLRETIASKYGDKVNFVYRSNRGANHPGTEPKGIGLLCAGKLGGETAYTKFLTYVMDRTTFRPQKRDGTVFPVENLSEAAKAAGVDVAKWKSCLDTKETLSQFNAQTQETSFFGLSGTPGTVIIDNKTGKFIPVVGAQGIAAFTTAIDSLLSNK